MGLLELYKAYPRVSQKWIDDIVFYRVWPMIEQDQGVNIHIKDMMDVNMESLQEFAAQIGFVAKDREFAKMLEAKKTYHHYYEWSDEDDRDSNL